MTALERHLLCNERQYRALHGNRLSICTASLPSADPRACSVLRSISHRTGRRGPGTFELGV